MCVEGGNTRRKAHASKRVCAAAAAHTQGKMSTAPVVYFRKITDYMF